MKKQNFLSEVRLGINNKSPDSLTKLVLEFARLIPRDEFEKTERVLQWNIRRTFQASPATILIYAFCTAITNQFTLPVHRTKSIWVGV